jgi:hypothetical protein
MRNVSDKSCRENQNTHFMFNNAFFYCTIYKILRNNIVQSDRPQMTIWRMRIACSIPKTKQTHRICNTYCSAIATIVARTRLNVTSHVHCIVVYFKQTRTKTHVDLLTDAQLVHYYSWKFEDAFTTPTMKMTVTITSHSNVSMCRLCRYQARQPSR